MGGAHVLESVDKLLETLPPEFSGGVYFIATTYIDANGLPRLLDGPAIRRRLPGQRRPEPGRRGAGLLPIREVFC